MEMKELIQFAARLCEKDLPDDILFFVLHNCPLCGYDAGLGIVTSYEEYDDTFETSIRCPSCNYHFRTVCKRKKAQVEAMLHKIDV